MFGLDSRRDSVEIRRRLGYLPGDLRLYERMTGRELLHFFGHLRGVRRHGAGRRACRERLDLDLDRRIKELSRGNRQKVGLVQAFMHEPDLLVLDEPTSGLDPLVQETFYELVSEVDRRGGTVFLSSHVLSEVQHVADRVGLIREGRLELVDTRRQPTRPGVHDTSKRRLPSRHRPTHSPACPECACSTSTATSSASALEGEIDPLLKALARFHVQALDVHEADLEDVFLARYRSEEPDAA